MISYAGIPLSRVIYALYHGARQCPEGTPARMIEEIEGGVAVNYDSIDFDLYEGSGRLVGALNALPIDYYRGRSIKVVLDIAAERFDEQYYDLDNGPGAAARAIEEARHG